MKIKRQIRTQQRLKRFQFFLKLFYFVGLVASFWVGLSFTEKGLAVENFLPTISEIEGEGGFISRKPGTDHTVFINPIALKADMPAPEIIFSGAFGKLTSEKAADNWYEKDLRYSFYPIGKPATKGTVGVYSVADAGVASSFDGSARSFYGIGRSGSFYSSSVPVGAYNSTAYAYLQPIDFSKPNTFGMMYLNHQSSGPGFTFSFVGANAKGNPEIPLTGLMSEYGSTGSGLGAYPTHGRLLTQAQSNTGITTEVPWSSVSYPERFKRYISNGVAVEVDGVANWGEDLQSEPGYNQKLVQQGTRKSYSHLAITKLGSKDYVDWMAVNGNHNHYKDAEGKNVGPVFSPTTYYNPVSGKTDETGLYSSRYYRYLEVTTEPYEVERDGAGNITKVKSISLQATVYYTSDPGRTSPSAAFQFNSRPLISQEYIMAQTSQAVVPMTDLDPTNGPATSYYWLVTSASAVNRRGTGTSPVPTQLFLVDGPSLPADAPGKVDKQVAKTKNETSKDVHKNTAQNGDELTYTLEYTHAVGTGNPINPWPGTNTNLEYFEFRDKLDKRLIPNVTAGKSQYRIVQKTGDTTTVLQDWTNLLNADGSSVWQTTTGDNASVAYQLNWVPNTIGGSPTTPIVPPSPTRIVLEPGETIQVRFYAAIDLTKGNVTVTALEEGEDGPVEVSKEVPYTEELGQSTEYTTIIENYYKFVGLSSKSYLSEATQTTVTNKSSDSLTYNHLFVRQVFRKDSQTALGTEVNLAKASLPIPTPGYVKLNNTLTEDGKTKTVTYYSPIVSYLYNLANKGSYGFPADYTELKVPIYSGSQKTEDTEKITVQRLDQPLYYRYVGYKLTATAETGELPADGTLTSTDQKVQEVSVPYGKYLTFVYEPVSLTVGELPFSGALRVNEIGKLTGK